MDRMPDTEEHLAYGTVGTVIAPPPTRSADRRRIALIAGAIVALAVIISGVFFIVTRPNATLTATNAYCTALQNKNYAQAYALLAPKLQDSMGADGYRAAESDIDSQGGAVTACSFTKTDVTGDSAIAHGTFKRGNNGKTQKLDLSLAQISSGTWRIDRSPDAMLRPLATAFTFCKALSLGQADAAYKMLSPDFQHLLGLPLQSFQDDLKQSIGVTGALKDCALQQFAPGSDSRTTSIKSGITFENFTNVPAELDVVYETATSRYYISGWSLYAVGLKIDFPFPLILLDTILSATGNAPISTN